MTRPISSIIETFTVVHGGDHSPAPGIWIESFQSRNPEDYEVLPGENRRRGGLLWEDAVDHVVETLEAWREMAERDGPQVFGPDCRSAEDCDRWISFWRSATPETWFGSEETDKTNL